MKNVEYLIGSAGLTRTPLPVFSDDACGLLKEFSGAIMHDKEARGYPDVISVGYWCRNANIQSKKEAFGSTGGCVGRGLAFHITPGNIPVNFMFSYLFSLLAGNANLVRIPSKPFPQIGILLRLLKACLADFPTIAERTAFVSYPNDNELSAAFSAQADVRVIWGGDKTVETIRSMPSKPRCVDIAFADRYSIAVFSGDAMERTGERELEQVAHSFYNDTYMMDQNACSSPRLVLWTDGNEAGQARFWNAVAETAARQYRLQSAVGVDKYTRLCQDVMDRTDILSVRRWGNLLDVVTLSALPADTEALSGNAGYFYECAIGDVSELAKLVTERFQTVVYFGIDADALLGAVEACHMTGIDRIVPVGSAMDIDSVWDGFDLISAMSRKIVLRK